MIDIPHFQYGSLAGLLFLLCITLSIGAIISRLIKKKMNNWLWMLFLLTQGLAYIALSFNDVEQESRANNIVLRFCGGFMIFAAAFHLVVMVATKERDK